MSRSPFPGMDPWLEDRWPEVHASLIVYSRNQINSQLPDDLQANIEETLTVFAEDDDERSVVRPDVNVSADGPLATMTAAQSKAKLATPTIVKRIPHPTRRVEIKSTNGHTITAIEFISPWNKIGRRARDQYENKQVKYFEAGVNLVEIDLVARSEYVLAAPFEHISPTPTAPYLMCVYRNESPDVYEIYEAPLQQELPNIPIPLRRGEADITLELQPLIDDCYRDGRYYRTDYSKPPAGTFNQTDAVWTAERLSQQGKV